MLKKQVSVMSVMEWRGMGIPLFAPSLNLLCRWHMRYGLVFERRSLFVCLLASQQRFSRCAKWQVMA